MTEYSGIMADPLLGGYRRTQYISSRLITVSNTNYEKNTLTQDGFKDTTKLGYRHTGTKSILPVSLFGRVIPTAALDPDRTYRMIEDIGVGSRGPWYDESSFSLIEASFGKRTHTVRQGIGTYGILFEPETPQTEERKIRRWPRDWHGENMN